MKVSSIARYSYEVLIDVDMQAHLSIDAADGRLPIDCCVIWFDFKQAGKLYCYFYMMLFSNEYIFAFTIQISCEIFINREEELDWIIKIW